MANPIKISEAASLGLHTMALLASNERRFTNHEIAKSLGGSGHHLAKVMQRLVRAGLVDSIRGPQGGFLLKKPADRTTLLEIYESIEGPLNQTSCLSDGPACHGASCILGRAIQAMRGQFRDFLGKTMLNDLVEGFDSPVAIGDQETHPIDGISEPTTILSERKR